MNAAALAELAAQLQAKESENAQLKQQLASAKNALVQAQNRIKELEKRLKFEQENNAKLKAEINKYNRWVNEIQANAQDKLDEKDAKIAILQGKVLKLVNDYV